MDREQEELQFLGLFGIYREAIKIIVSWRKIFGQITLTFILPLTIIFLAHMEVSNLIARKIMHTEFEMHITQPGTQRHDKLSDALKSEWIMYWLFKAAYFTFLLVFSLLSTSAVVYSIACIYTSRDITFNKVLTVVPKVWKRLVLTFLCMFAAFFIYHMIVILILVLYMVHFPDNTFGVVVFYFMLILYFVGIVYMSVIWHLASVVTVLESSYGIKAMMKSMDLIKGKRWAAAIIFFKLNFSFLATQVVFQMFVVHGSRTEMWRRVGFGVLCLLLLLKLCLFGLVTQTVLYLVCKSYHHEYIDKASLADFIEGYLGDYEPLKGDIDVQLEQCRV